MEESRDLGGLGESQFENWSKQVGFTVNKSIIDRTGWDYLVEFPSNHLSSNSEESTWDQITPSIECRIQVKSNDIYQGKGRSSINLSHVLRFLNSPLPVFFLFFEYGGKNSPQNAYIVHFDEQLMERALKRLRNEYIGSKAKLHNKTFNISYGSQHKLNGLSGTVVKNSIIDHIGNFSEYCERKVSYVKTAGYIGTGNEITAQFESKIHPSELFVNFGIGLLDSIDIRKFIGVNKRFGIAAPKPFIEGENATLRQPKDRKPNTTGVIKVKENEFSNEVILKSDVYLPIGGTFDISNPYLKVRFSTTFNDFTVSLFKAKIEILPKQISAQTELNIEDFYRHFQILEIMAKSYKNQSPLTIEAIADTIQVCNAKVLPSSQIEVDFQFYEIIKTARAIANKLEINDLFRISIDQIYQLKEKFKLFYCLLGFKTETLTVTNPIEANKKYNTETLGIPIVQALNIADFSVVLAVAAIGIPEIETNHDASEVKFTFKSPEMQIVRKLIIKNPKNFSPQEIQKDCEKAILEYLTNQKISVLSNL